MKIKQALKLGLLRQGIRVKTNGAVDDVDSGLFFGTIYDVEQRYFTVARDDGKEGSGRNGTWRIRHTNTKASIEFESTEVILTVVKYYTLNLAKCRYADGKEMFVRFKRKRKRSLKKGYTVNVVQTPTCWTEI